MTFKSREMIVAATVSTAWGALATLLMSFLMASIDQVSDHGGELHLTGPKAVLYMIRGSGDAEAYLYELIGPFLLVSASIFVGCLLFSYWMRR